MTILNTPETDELSADVHIAADSPWFKGHFPGMPVLPGIAQLSMVWELIRQVDRRAVALTAINRVRFKKLILPGDRIRIEATHKGRNDGTFAFRILNHEELVSSGNLTVGLSETPVTPQVPYDPRRSG